MFIIIDDALFWEHAVVEWTFHHTEYMRVWGWYLDPVMASRLHHAINGRWLIFISTTLIFDIFDEFQNKWDLITKRVNPEIQLQPRRKIFTYLLNSHVLSAEISLIGRSTLQDQKPTPSPRCIIDPPTHSMTIITHHHSRSIPLACLVEAQYI